jgi:hypothetical protein
LTASPMRREVTKPNRVSPPPTGSCAALSRISRPCTDLPAERT